MLPTTTSSCHNSSRMIRQEGAARAEISCKKRLRATGKSVII